MSRPHDELIQRLRESARAYALTGNEGCREYQLLKEAADTLDELTRPHGTYQCFHCLAPYSVVWDSDWDFSDFGYEGEGIVQMLHCSECGAEIEYRISFGDDE